MSLEARHAYRCGYLKSEKWGIVRLEALVRDKAECQICNAESIFNDAHHVWYPERSVWDTTVDNVVILCRPCHLFLHVMLPDCKTNDKAVGLAHWRKFRTAILKWRIEKIGKFKNTDGLDCITREQVELALRKLKQLFSARYKTKDGMMMVPRQEFFSSISSLVQINGAITHNLHKQKRAKQPNPVPQPSVAPTTP